MLLITFGNIRGKNEFENCDLLFVIGRHEVDRNSLEDWVYAVFNKGVDCSREIVEVPVRMKGDRWVSIENLVYPDKDIEAIKNHICKSETHQSCGRIRWFSKHPNNLTKTILLLSSESLGHNVEVDEWIRSEDFLEEPRVTRCQEDVRLIGINKQKQSRSETEFQKKLSLLTSRNLPNVKDNYKEFIEIGFKKSFSQNKKLRHAFMIEAGYHLVDGIWLLNI